MKAVLVCLALAATLVAANQLLTDSEYETLFSKWVAEHSRVYESTEEMFKRYHVWRANMDVIIRHNNANKSWTLGMNQFGDLTNQEFVSRMNGYRAANHSRRAGRRQHNLRKSLPASVDWTTHNPPVVTGVKNQGQCGSCWAFSTTGSTEGTWALAGNSLVSLSEQELVDCAGSTGNEGCNGGEMQDAMQWIINNGGICSEAAYPYTAEDGTCQSTQCTDVAHISSYVSVTANSESALQQAVAQQPTSVAVDASGSDWQFYSGGIVNDPNCYNSLDHGVLAVGYGTSSGQAYWYVKNSWGASWGESGYIYLARNTGYPGGECGIAMDASYPVV